MTKTEFLDSDCWRKLDVKIREVIRSVDQEYRTAGSMHEVRYSAGFADALEFVLALPEKLLSDGEPKKPAAVDGVLELNNHPRSGRNMDI